MAYNNRAMDLARNRIGRESMSGSSSIDNKSFTLTFNEERETDSEKTDN